MSEYDRTLAIDKISRELGITENEILSQLEEFRSGAVKPSNQAKTANSLRIGKVSSLLRRRERALQSISRIPTNIDFHMILAIQERRDNRRLSRQ